MFEEGCDGYHRRYAARWSVHARYRTAPVGVFIYKVNELMRKTNFRHRSRVLVITHVIAFSALVDAKEPEDTRARSLAATCASCHNRVPAGGGALRSLTGVPRQELILAMQSFKAGTRPATVMQQLAKGYTDAQIDTIATWYAGQHATR